MWLDLIALVLATGAIIEVWHKGSIFEGTRAKIEALQDVTDPDTWRGRWYELLMCPFCKSYHVPFWLLLALTLAASAGAAIEAGVRLVIYSLAATRLSNLIEAFLPDSAKYVPPLFPRDNESTKAD